MHTFFLMVALMVLGMTLTALATRARNKPLPHLPKVPWCIQKAAQYAANMSQQDQTVLYDGDTYHISKSRNQYAARGVVAMVVHPESN